MEFLLLRVSAKVDRMRLFGTPKDDVTPVIVRSVQKESGMKSSKSTVFLKLELLFGC